MRHRKSRKRLPGGADKARADLHNLTVALLSNGRISTTVLRAKVLRPHVERLITRGKLCALSPDYSRKDASYRDVLARLRNNKLAATLVTRVWGPYFLGRPGGYTRIMRLHFRPGDRAEMAIIEFVRHDSWPEKNGSTMLGDFSDTLSSVDDYVVSGPRFMEAWRRVPKPRLRFDLVTSNLDTESVFFKIRINNAFGARTMRDERSSKRWEDCWPSISGRPLPMVLQAFVVAPNPAGDFGAALVEMKISGEKDVVPSSAATFYLEPNSPQLSIDGRVHFEQGRKIPPYCMLFIEGPQGELLKADLI